MADRNTAKAFGALFDLLALGETIDAATLWRLQQRFDFHPAQMNCDPSLRVLDLLRSIPDPEDPPQTIDQYGPIHEPME